MKQALESHPSYGCVNVSRRTGDADLAGSQVKAYTWYAITINKAQIGAASKTGVARFLLVGHGPKG